MPAWWQIKETLDIPEVLDNLGIRVTRVDGHEHFASCPLSSHTGEDRNPSFSVNEDKMLYSCFACSGGGVLPNLVMDIENLSWDEALEWLSEYSDEITDEPDAFARQLEKALFREETKEAPKPLPWFGPKVIAPWIQEETDWFADRGISQSTRELLSMGFDPNHERRTRSLTEPYIGPAIIVPHFFNGSLCGWQERWLDEDRPKWIGKYTNTHDFPKKYTLYNYDAAKEHDSVIVVEGTMTVARLVQLGYNAVATFGATVSNEQWKMLSAFRNVFLSFDNDDAGYIAMETGVMQLMDLTSVWVIDPPQDKKGADLGDVSDNDIGDHIARAEPGFMKV